MLDKKIRVMVVDDSLLYRKLLIDYLSQQPNIDVIGYALNGLDAKAKVPVFKPDVLTLDVEMPGLSGIDFLKQLIPQNPIPVILVTSLNLNVFEALSAGAVDFVRKPDMTNQNTTRMFLESLANKITIASRAKVIVPAAPAAASVLPKTVSKPATGLVAAGVPPVSPQAEAPITPVTPAAPAAPISSVGYRSAQTPRTAAITLPPTARVQSSVIAIGASTGGTEATLAVLKQLPSDSPGIVITQHMPEGFTKMYAERLNRICAMEVREARNGDHIHRGLALIAPGNLQMKVVRMGSQYTVSCYSGERVSGHIPSVDVLFTSMADAAGPSGIGIILTGMGRDGADGLLKMRKRGAFTIGQDKDTCVVYGMPMVAYNIGAVCVQSPLENIPSVLKNYLCK